MWIELRRIGYRKLEVHVETARIYWDRNIMWWNWYLMQSHVTSYYISVYVVVKLFHNPLLMWALDSRALAGTPKCLHINIHVFWETTLYQMAYRYRHFEKHILLDYKYSVIPKDGLNFVRLYFKIRTSDKYGINYIWLYSQWSWMLKRRRNARCTAVADSVLLNSRTQKKILCCIVAILLSTDAATRLCARRAL
jgi:hypothetical protein